METVQHHRSKDLNIFFNGKLVKELGEITKKPLKTNTKTKTRIHIK